MRVTLNNTYSSALSASSDHYSSLANMAERVQYRVIQASDDPVAQKTIINLRNNIADLSLYKDQNTNIESTLTGIEVGLDAYHDRLLKFGELAISVADGTSSQETYKVYSDHLADVEDEMAKTLNSRDAGGKYVFGGTATDSPPFEKETVSIDIDGVSVAVSMYVYKGNSDLMLNKSGVNSFIPVTVDGSEVVSGAGGGTVFEDIARANYYLSQGQVIPVNISNDLSENLMSLTDAYIGESSVVGGNIVQAQNNQKVFNTMTLQYSAQLSTAQDTDLVKMVTDIEKHSQILKVINNTVKVLTEMNKQSFLG